MDSPIKIILLTLLFFAVLGAPSVIPSLAKIPVMKLLPWVVRSLVAVAAVNTALFVVDVFSAFDRLGRYLAVESIFGISGLLANVATLLTLAVAVHCLGLLLKDRSTTEADRPA